MDLSHRLPVLHSPVTFDQCHAIDFGFNEKNQLAVNNGYDSVRGAVNRIGRNKPDWGKGEDKNWWGDLSEYQSDIDLVISKKKKNSRTDFYFMFALLFSSAVPTGRVGQGNKTALINHQCQLAAMVVVGK